MSTTATSVAPDLLFVVALLQISVESVASLNPVPLVQLSVTIPGLLVDAVTLVGFEGTANSCPNPDTAL